MPIDYEGIFGVSYEPSINWTLVVSSADGNKLTAAEVDGPFYNSSDAGTNWMFVGPFSSFPYEGWSGLCSSADGNKLVAVGQNGAFASLDSGNTWTDCSPAIGTGYFSCVATSSDGNRLVAGSSYNSVYTSTNFGATWTTVGPSFELLWGSVASSADGHELVAAAYASAVIHTNGSDIYTGGPIYISTNSGATWTLTDAPLQNWQSVASSSDGHVLIAAANGGPVCISTNSGAHWNLSDAPITNWSAIACSADATKMFAAANQGGIWISQASPAPILYSKTTGTNFVVSWIIPSTNFVLQQSSDLSSWSAVTNSPVLNLTNLQNRVTLPMPVCSQFYRLKTL